MGFDQTRVSLKTRIAATVLALFLACIWLLAYLAAGRLRDGFSEVLKNQQYSSVSQTAAEVEGKLEERFNALRTIAAEITPAMLASPPKLKALLVQRPLLARLFGVGVVVISREGSGLATQPDMPERLHADFTQREYFQEVVETARPVLGKARIGRVSNKLGVAMAVPVFDAQRQVAAVLVGYAALADNSLFGSIMKGKVGKTGWIAVSDARHRMIVAINDPTRILQPFPKPGVNAMLDKFVAGYEGSGISINSKGIEVLSSGKSIGKTGWIVQSVLPTDEAFEPIRATLAQIYAIAGALSVLAMAIVWFVIKTLLNPLGEAAADMRRMTSGETELAELPVTRRDEIGELLTSFNILFKQRQAKEIALRENETHLRTVLENEPECIKVVDDQGRLCQMNPAGLAMIEADAFDQVAGRPVLDVIAPEFRAVYDAMHRRIIAGESAQFEYEVLGLKGGRRYVETHAVPMREEGRVVHLAVTRDISERKAHENQLRQALAAAESANLAKSAFLATMSHEIRTPMNGILGMAQLMMEGGLSEDERREFARVIFNSGQTLLTLLNDILDLSKIEAGRIELEDLAFDPAQIAHDVAALFSEQAHAKGLRLDVVWQGPQEGGFRADHVRLRQMLSNLVSNAIKFTPSGRIGVEGRIEAADDGEATLEYAVVDSGIGIADDKLDLLFKPFSQVDASNTRQYGGTGLGLSIVRTLAHIMGGEVGVASKPREGSRFWFRVRVKRIAPGEERRQSVRAEEPADAGAPQATAAGEYVLVVEDNQTNRRVIEALLKRRGIKFESVENGAEAVRIVTAGVAPALILMDCQMPVMDGFAATEAIRQWERSTSSPRLPIIALTAGAFQEDRDHCLAAGMDDFVAKPVDVAQLLMTMGKWMAVPGS